MNKLSLNREILRNLSDHDAHSVNGGTSVIDTNLPSNPTMHTCNACGSLVFNPSIYINPIPFGLR